MELRIYPSATGFEEVYFLADLIARYSNAHLFYDLRGLPLDECKAFVRELKDMFEELTH